MNSDGWTLTTKSESQRRDPLTDLPMPGTSTRTRNTAPAMNSQGASRCQAFTGTWTADAAATSPTTTNMPCRMRKYQARLPVCVEASDIAIDAE
jgi:hypothetical protein